MHNILVFLFTCIFYQSLCGQKLWETGRVKGIWTTDEKVQQSNTWKAQWIWLSKKEESHMMLSRKSFLLDALPKSHIENNGHLPIQTLHQRAIPNPRACQKCPPSPILRSIGNHPFAQKRY
jgi:hypothetical protein